MIHKEFNIKMYNTNIYGQYFQPETVRAVVLLIHGMGEHAKCYENFVIPYFNKNGIGVLTYDQFGHGLTEGKRGHNPGFEAVLDCVQEMLKKTVQIFGEKPTFLYGHSMGGNVVINYVLRRKNNLNGVIASSPFLRLAFDPPIWKMTLGKILQKITPAITLSNELNTEDLSRDKDEIERYINDPLIHDKISANYSIVFMETGEWALEHAHQLKKPMLLMHGTGDKITSHQASEAFKKSGSKQVELKLYQGAYHELHNDIIKNDVVKTMVTWIDKKINLKINKPLDL